MEELTKYQIVLLTLFTSFVTSLATGIVTVSLMDQSPEGVTQNFNKVVERTIERVVEGPGEVTKVEVPVVVAEEDLIVRVVDAAIPSIAKVVIKSGGKEDVVAVSSSLGGGWFISSPLPELPPGATVELLLDDGKRLPVEKMERHDTITALKYIGGSVPSLKFAAKEASIGQTVVGVGSASSERNGISVGIVSGVGQLASSTTSLLRTNAATTENNGGPLLNIKGEMVGISYKAGSALSIESLKALIDSLK